MTIDTIVRRVNYQGDDRTTCFPFPFKVWGEEQVVVYCSDPETPWTETNITQRTTITLNADNYGGAVRFANPPASGTNLAIVREGNFLQEDEYLSGSRFDAHEIEDRFDEDAAERQELLDATARSIKVPNSSTLTPEEVYEQLISSVTFINNALATLTDLYEQAVYYYNLALGLLGDISYTKAQEVSFTVDQTHIVDEEDGWVCDIPNGFRYYPATHQLLVTVDGLALTPSEHFGEIGDYGEESTQIRFKINMYQGQQVYIKAIFLGTEEFDVKVQEMNNRIEEANKTLQAAIDAANKTLQAAIDAANADFEEKENELKDLVEEAKKIPQEIVDQLEKEITQIEGLVQEAREIVGSNENWESFRDAVDDLNSIYSVFTSNELPTQGYCELTSGYSGNSCLPLPNGVCYFKDTNTLHLAIDGLVLSPKYFEEIDGCVCRGTVYGANYVKLCGGLCLYQGQELHAWTESFWGTADWEPTAYQPDITTRLYATSTSGNIYYSDDLGRCWRLRAAGLEDDVNGEDSAGQLPEYLRRQRIVATSDTLWAFTAPQKAEGNGTDAELEGDDQEEGDTENGEQGDESQEEDRPIAAKASTTEQEDAAPPAGTLLCSTDGGLTWDCYIKNGSDGDSNSNGWQSSFGDPYAFAATDNALVLATCQGLFCCPTGGAWDLIFPLGSNPPFTYCWGLIGAASDGSGFLAVDTTPWPEPDEEEEPKRRQIVYFGSAPSGGITYSCTNSISDVTAIVSNGQYWRISDACGQAEYAASSVATEAWQASAEPLAGSVNCIYGAREGFVALGSGIACTASPRNAWKCSVEVSGTLCAGLHLPDHGLYLAVGGDASRSYTLWSWDGLNWNCGCGVPNNAVLNNIWTSEHLPFFTDEPVTALEPMSPAGEAKEDEVPPEEDDSQEENGGGDSGNDEDKNNESEDRNQPEAIELSPSTSENDHCYLWGPISPTYQLKSNLCFDSSAIPVHITIDRDMREGTGENNSHGNGATITIYKSDTYQRLMREDLNIENNDSEDEKLEALAASEQAWCEFARYEACGPINADTELYTCFTTAGQNGSGEATVEDGSETEAYPTCWPAGYYAVAIYCVYGGCSLQKCIPKVNFYVSRKERYSSCAAGAEEGAAGTEPDNIEGEETND